MLKGHEKNCQRLTLPPASESLDSEEVVRLIKREDTHVDINQTNKKTIYLFVYYEFFNIWGFNFQCSKVVFISC